MYVLWKKTDIPSEGPYKVCVWGGGGGGTVLYNNTRLYGLLYRSVVSHCMAVVVIGYTDVLFPCPI